MKAKLFKTPFCTFSSWTLYSFIKAGKTVKGPLYETIAIATVVHTLNCLYCTLRLFRSVTKTSCGPIALAMNPKVTIVALLIFFLCAFSIYSKSKHILIHYLGETSSAPLSAILPTSSIQFSWTFSFLFFNIGVNLGNRSFIGGVILAIPISITILFNAPRILPNTSGYSSRRHSFKFKPNLPNLAYSPQIFIEWAILTTRSAACCLILILLWLSLQWIVPTICTKYGLALIPIALTIAPNPFRMILSSVFCSWKAAKTQSISSFLRFYGAYPISEPLGDYRILVNPYITIFLKDSFSSLRPRYSFSTI